MIENRSLNSIITDSRWSSQYFFMFLNAESLKRSVTKFYCYIGVCIVAETSSLAPLLLQLDQNSSCWEISIRKLIFWLLPSSLPHFAGSNSDFRFETEERVKWEGKLNEEEKSRK